MIRPVKQNQAGAGNAGPVSKADTLGKVEARYPETQKAATVTPFPSKRLTVRRRASLRLADLYRLAAFRRANGIVVDADLFAFVLAATLACGKPGAMAVQGRKIPWYGLDVLSLGEAVRRANLGHMGDDELFTKIKAVELYQEKHGTNLISAKWLGERLELTSAERSECDIRTIDAIDEPKAERQARKREEKRSRDQDYNRTQRGRQPLSIRRSFAEARRLFCEQHDITDRTLRRWAKAGKANVQMATFDHIESQRSASPTGHRAEQDGNQAVATRARTARPKRSVGADGPSPGGKAIAGEPSRSGGDASSDETEEPEAGLRALRAVLVQMRGTSGNRLANDNRWGDVVRRNGARQ